jgi:CAAX prenyl protease-like protein
MGRASGYVIVIIFECAVVVYIWFGAGQRGIGIRDLVGGSRVRPIHFLRDLAIAIVFLIVAAGVLSGLDYFVKTAPNPAIRNLLPRTPIELALFLASSLTAGFCEELIYRGYLQRQFTALTHTVAGGNCPASDRIRPQSRLPRVAIYSVDRGASGNAWAAGVLASKSAPRYNRACNARRSHRHSSRPSSPLISATYYPLLISLGIVRRSRASSSRAPSHPTLLEWRYVALQSSVSRRTWCDSLAVNAALVEC